MIADVVFSSYHVVATTNIVVMYIIALLQSNICMQGQDCTVLDVLKHPRCEAVINNKVILFQ